MLGSIKAKAITSYGISTATRTLSTTYTYPKKVENVLIYEKLTPYAYHKSQNKQLNPNNFGNLPLMQKANIEHEANMKIVTDTLLKNEIRSENIKHIKTRQEGYDLLKKRYDDPFFEPFKPDLIIATGGDGTFLRASHLLDEKLGTAKVPILGINTNPDLSVGRLCINTNGLKLHDIVELAVCNETINVLPRSRIKILMSSRSKTDFQTRDFHYDNIPLSTPSHRIVKTSSIDDPEIYNTMNIPIMALNDVFVGERAASMVTNLEINYKFKGMNPEDDEWITHHSQKNSGIIVSTGTGSTGWSKSSNHICAETMLAVIEQLKKESTSLEDKLKLADIDYQAFADRLNSSRTVFKPEAQCLGLTFREPINSKISEGNDGNFMKVTSLKAKSKLTYGMISIDGTTYYDFSRGAIAELQTHPDFAINCVTTGHDDRDI